MVLRQAISGTLCACLFIGQPVLGGPPADSSLSAEPIVLCSYPGNNGFIHETGYHVPQDAWAARYRIDIPGYFVKGRVNGGEPLADGAYQYAFYVALEDGSLGGLLQRATDVARVEVWDATTHERLLFRTFQIADFPNPADHLFRKTLTFSAAGRSGHVFEPRIYWSGLCSFYLKRVELQRLISFSSDFLAKKADVFEAMMGDQFTDRGFVVSRDLQGHARDTGDAAIWTGLYAASEAWRYRATRSKEAMARMEDALRALHELQVLSDRPGTIVRYVDHHNRPMDEPSASRDSYTGFFFAIANCLSEVHDRVLRRELLQDTEAIANHLIDHDLAFVPGRGRVIAFSPFPSNAALEDAFRELRESPTARQGLTRLLQGIHLYFLSHGQRPWPELLALIRALKHNDIGYVRQNLIPILNGVLRALAQLQRNVQRSDDAYRSFLTYRQVSTVSYPEAPYGKLNNLLMHVLGNLSYRIDGQALGQLSDVKVLPSQALHALHFLKVAAEVLPKPNRFDAYYRANLWENKKLLKTVIDWDNVDDKAFSAMFGHSRAAVMRGNNQQLPFLALFDLINLERDKDVREHYRSLFEEDYLPIQEDFNAMVHVMRGALKMPPAQTGIGLWSLMLYPTDRRGLGAHYWRRHQAEWAARYGGKVLSQTRDPVPLDQRQRDAFIWQRSARSIGGDDDRMIYPPMDYLFVYWMARAYDLVSSSPN